MMDLEEDPMSLVDAEMSRLKAELRLAERKLVAAREIAGSFIRKAAANLVTERCTYCDGEWVRYTTPEHDTDCPVEIVLGGSAEPREPEGEANHAD